uniref:PH domain-containing protein n=1 Tax=Globisporangium ultimum (strain ATCC 200006 / CBS 805.95 / DAOM BR144) TaxID=431595 RepID=K3WP80_GLOUD
MSAAGSNNAERDSDYAKSGDGVYVTKSRSTFSMWLHGKTAPPRTNPAVVFRSADVIQEGYLMKQGLRLKMWTKRYFILRLEERHMTLGYYTSKESLVLCSETPIGPGHMLAPVNTTKHPRRLELRCGTKSLIVEAEDEKSYTTWKKALQEAIRWNHAMVPTKDGSFVQYGKQATEDKLNEERSRTEAAKKMREKQRADEATAAANAANKPNIAIGGVRNSSESITQPRIQQPPSSDVRRQSVTPVTPEVLSVPADPVAAAVGASMEKRNSVQVRRSNGGKPSFSGETQQEAGEPAREVAQ